jgi:hypothetical protein
MSGTALSAGVVEATTTDTAEGRGVTMTSNHNMRRCAAAAILSGSVMLTSIAFATVADASPGAIGPSQWCPGQRLPQPDIVWDMSVCHTFYTVFGGAKGNVGQYTWEGDNPPVAPDQIDHPPHNCGLFGCVDPGGH